MSRLGLAEQVVEQTSGFLGRGRPTETGAGTLLGIRSKGELRHQQQAAPNVTDREVHAPLRVRENTVAEKAFEQSVGGGFIIAAAHSYKSEQPSADAANGPPLYVN